MAKGFNRPAGGGMAGGGMMEQIKKMQDQLAAAQEQLASGNCYRQRGRRCDQDHHDRRSALQGSPDRPRDP